MREGQKVRRNKNLAPRPRQNIFCLLVCLLVLLLSSEVGEDPIFVSCQLCSVLTPFCLVNEKNKVMRYLLLKCIFTQKLFLCERDKFQ